jgi:hypothetical protein
MNNPKHKYKFIKTSPENDQYDDTDVSVSTNSITLEPLLDTFESFLKACGYVFSGKLEIVDDEIIQPIALEEHDFDSTNYVKIKATKKKQASKSK